MVISWIYFMKNSDFMDIFHEKHRISWTIVGGFVWIFHGMNHRDMVEIIGKSAQSADGFLM